MVVMITPVSFSSIGYRTYIIFAVINAFIFPAVYFFYPETAYRSLEEMDAIFRKTQNVFTVVQTAKDEPRRYGKNGEVLIEYDQLDEHRRRTSAAQLRRESRASGGRASRRASRAEKSDYEHGERTTEREHGIRQGTDTTV